MIDRLIDYLRARMALEPRHEALVRSLMKAKQVRKGEMLQRAGDRVQYGYFVARGCLRKFLIDDKGREHILQFAPENWWLVETTALREGQPARFFFEALEDSDLVLTEWPAHDRFMVEIPGYAEAFGIGVQRQSAAREQRVLDVMSTTAEERYLKFLDTYPSIVLRVPQHMLASYLGITPETLSRVRARVGGRRSERRPT